MIARASSDFSQSPRWALTLQPRARSCDARSWSAATASASDALTLCESRQGATRREFDCQLGLCTQTEAGRISEACPCGGNLRA